MGAGVSARDRAHVRPRTARMSERGSNTRHRIPSAHTSETTSTSLASRVPDGSKRLVKSLAGILVIYLRIEIGSQRGHKQLYLNW
jgi:hypothetical protein